MGGLATPGYAAEARYTFGGADPRAVQLYQRGWQEILTNGRWSESERLYREALLVDPGFTIAKAVLGRITLNGDERRELQRQIAEERPRVDEDGELILSVYVDTLRLFNAREAGTKLPAGFRENMAKRAVENYRRFLAKYPGEWSVLIEYIEWVHALRGPRAAIDAAQSMSDLHKEPPSFSYFLASFYAELGEFEKAWALERDFSSVLDAAVYPQVFYLRALIWAAQGDKAAAKRAVQKALALDSRHLLAQRLLAALS
ncbi:MAG: hypothetical protein Cons2KO_27880 [Congregibacter sp.]